MLPNPPLLQAFKELEAEDVSPQRRGKAFETLIAQLFQRAHFDVAVDAGGAHPRQTDLIATDLPDVDWVPASGSGVCLDVSVAVANRDGLLALLTELTGRGWATDAGHWCIHQSDDNWHGMGASSLAASLAGLEARYAPLAQAHHREVIVYHDACDGGHFTVVADLAVRPPHQVWHVNLSFQLIGVPLDQEPLRSLSRALGVTHQLYFRPLGRRSVERAGFDRTDAPKLEPLSLVVEDDPEGPDAGWVTGIVARSPFLTEGAPDGVPRAIAESEVLVCDLSSHHPADLQPDGYILVGLEHSSTSDATVVRAVADWIGDVPAVPPVFSPSESGGVAGGPGRSRQRPPRSASRGG